MRGRGKGGGGSVYHERERFALGRKTTKRNDVQHHNLHQKGFLFYGRLRHDESTQSVGVPDENRGADFGLPVLHPSSRPGASDSEHGRKQFDEIQKQ